MSPSYLVILCPHFKETLLDGKLQQIILLLPDALPLFAPKNTVALGGIEHAGGNLPPSA